MPIILSYNYYLWILFVRKFAGNFCEQIKYLEITNDFEISTLKNIDRYVFKIKRVAKIEIAN